MIQEKDMFYYPYFNFKDLKSVFFKKSETNREKKLRLMKEFRKSQLEQNEIPNSNESFKVKNINNHPVYQAFTSF